MKLNDLTLQSTVFLIKGEVTDKGKTYAFWYEYDLRDGASDYQFVGEEPDDNTFDWQTFDKMCDVKMAQAIFNNGKQLAEVL